MKEKRQNTPQGQVSPKKKRVGKKSNPMGTAFYLSVAETPIKKPRASRASSATKTTKTPKTPSNRGGEGQASTRKKGQKKGKKQPVTTQERVGVDMTTPVASGAKKRISKPKDSNKDFQPLSLSVEPTASTKGKSSKKKKDVKILFLGGVGEIGKNMTALEYGNDIIIIDAGLSFPDEEMPGVDSVVPDVSYLAQNKDKVRGVVLTHGHEDHIGGVPYLMKELNPDTAIYGTKLTLMLTDNKLQERHLTDVVGHVVKAGERIKLGAFEVEFINVNHSISGACALAIHTPVGVVYHSGDFKIDLTPVAGEPIDFKRIAELGNEGVLLYMGESTNIERAGYTMSETVVGTTLDHLFSENVNRRLIIATFASNVHRLQQIIDLAVKYRRKVALSGRSMFKVVDAAVKIGELIIPEGVLIDVEKTKNLFDGEMVILSTGSQGEPMSALTRMAAGEFNKVTIGENDTIIISANPIPGNEKMIYRVINNLYKKGARVVYESLEKIHVSGHACQEEHKILHSLLKPKFFIPVHGEYRHLKRHAQLAQTMGMPERNILITEIGNCVLLNEKEMKFGESIPAGTRVIDGEGIEDYGDSEVIKDRLKMSADGVFSVAIAVTGDYVINAPVVEAHGCVFAGELDGARAVVQRAVDACNYTGGNKEELCSSVRKALKNYFYKTTKQAPLIIVSVLDV